MILLTTLILGLTVFTTQVIAEHLRSLAAKGTPHELDHANKCFPQDRTSQRYHLTAQTLFNLRHQKP